jgi:hypothetical protein
MQKQSVQRLSLPLEVIIIASGEAFCFPIGTTKATRRRLRQCSSVITGPFEERRLVAAFSGPERGRVTGGGGTPWRLRWPSDGPSCISMQCSAV